MTNSVGIIDSGYRGTLRVAVWNRGSSPFTVEKGKALFQLVDVTLEAPLSEMLGEHDPRLSLYFGGDASLRGEGGFGSTGARGGQPPPADNENA
jgi:dUTP pyrophosphatase